MQIGATYSHLNGQEHLLVHKKALWRELLNVISKVDASTCKTVRPEEKTKSGQLLYSQTEIKSAIQAELEDFGWHQRRNILDVTSNEKLPLGTYEPSAEDPMVVKENAGYEAVTSYNQTDYVKDRVAVEVQFGNYAFVAQDLFAKHLSCYVSDAIDVGIEILPMKELANEMSSAVAYYERDLLRGNSQGRGIPAVPLVLIGVLP